MSRRIARTLDEAERFVREGRPFRLRGRGTPTLWATSEPPVHLGMIPPQYAVGAESADYWVYSYHTVIAWVTEGEPTVPDVGYSPTTGQHQLLVARALGADFRPARDRDLVGIPHSGERFGRPRRLRSGGIDGEADGDPDGHGRRGYREGYPPEPRQSAYAGVSGDAMHYSPSSSGTLRSHP